MSDEWPIDWPPGVDILAEDDYLVERAEETAAAVLRYLTLYRAGGKSITVMPCTETCCRPFNGGQFGNSYLPFYPILLNSGGYANCFCNAGCSCSQTPTVRLAGPVGRIDEVKIDGLVVPQNAYRVENGNRLVRTDGGTWPSCAGDNFTVTYLNAYPVGVLGQQVGGLLAHEYLKLFKDDATCRLPDSARSVSRNGVAVELTSEMFPEGKTGIQAVDIYLTQWNPHGVKSRPVVISPDMPEPRQITWGA
jgi:hypothetical protein